MNGDDLEDFCMHPGDSDPVAYMGINWYCSMCGTEYGDADAGEESTCPSCGRILDRHGGYVDRRTRAERQADPEGVPIR